MTKPTTKHTDVTIRAQKLFENALDSAIEPKFKRRLERDAKLLSEIREILYYSIENPTLPFADFAGPDHDPVLDPIEAEPNAAF